MKQDCRMESLVEAQHDARLGPREAASVERHVVSCASCRSQLDDIGHLAELGRRLGEVPPWSEMERRRRRVALLGAAARPQPSGRRPAPWGRATLGVAAACALCAVVALLVLVRPTPGPIGSRAEVGGGPAASTAGPGATRTAAGPPEATVVGVGDARFERQREGGMERVRLLDGTIEVRVRPLVLGQRFVVLTSDAELEVRGTRFVVAASHGVLREVLVPEGKVVLRRGASVWEIGAGEQWRAGAVCAVGPLGPELDETLAEASAAPASAAGARSATTAGQGHKQAKGSRRPKASEMAAAGHPSAPASSAGSAPIDRAADGASAEFAQAVELVERGEYQAGSDALRRFAQAHPSDARAEDADFLAIVALQRAGRQAAAARAARGFLDRYPHGARRAEALAIASGSETTTGPER
ncbi:MAG: FecR domain-containing protein [Deltaproteobacteria bacterium]|nr:FecR domain-containing protein [Deltaproteobacteria bacterium]